MKRLLTILFLSMFVIASCSSDNYERGIRADEPIPQKTELEKFLDNSDAYNALVAKCKTLLDGAYMAQTFISETTSYPNWTGFPVRLYEYETGTDATTGVKKKGKVYMLNPSPEKLATWIASACYKAKSSVASEYIDKVYNNIEGQSGAQFPVCGIVYEDMDGTGYYPYAFKDGVTVYVADASKWATESSAHAGNYACSDAQLENCINLTTADLKTYTGRYARICSTTREQYTANGGTLNVGTSDSQTTRSLVWMDAIRSLYQKAWTSDENELITAWAKDNL